MGFPTRTDETGNGGTGARSTAARRMRRMRHSIPLARGFAARGLAGAGGVRHRESPRIEGGGGFVLGQLARHRPAGLRGVVHLRLVAHQSPPNRLAPNVYRLDRGLRPDGRMRLPWVGENRASAYPLDPNSRRIAVRCGGPPTRPPAAPSARGRPPFFMAGER
jgi:hypothetical protein